MTHHCDHVIIYHRGCQCFHKLPRPRAFCAGINSRLLPNTPLLITTGEGWPDRVVKLGALAWHGAGEAGGGRGGVRTILGNACSPGQEAGLEKRTPDLNIPPGAHAAGVWSYDGVRGEKLGTSSRRLQSEGGDASWPGVCSFPPLLRLISLTGGRLHADWGWRGAARSWTLGRPWLFASI